WLQGAHAGHESGNGDDPPRARCARWVHPWSLLLPRGSRGAGQRRTPLRQGALPIAATSVKRSARGQYWCNHSRTFRHVALQAPGTWLGADTACRCRYPQKQSEGRQSRRMLGSHVGGSSRLRDGWWQSDVLPCVTLEVACRPSSASTLRTPPAFFFSK